MTPSVIEAHQRHKRFHASIASRAAIVPQREERSYSIPNVPFGIPKLKPMLPVRRPVTVKPEQYYQFMWFHDLVDYRGPVARGPLRIEDIQLAACQRFGFQRFEILSQRRHGPLVRARQIAVYLAKTLTSRSLPDIGRRFGNRDHTTILHAVRKIDRLLKTDLMLKADIAALTAELRA